MLNLGWNGAFFGLQFGLRVTSKFRKIQGINKRAMAFLATSFNLFYARQSKSREKYQFHWCSFNQMWRVALSICTIYTYNVLFNEYSIQNKLNCFLLMWIVDADDTIQYCKYRHISSFALCFFVSHTRCPSALIPPNQYNPTRWIQFVARPESCQLEQRVRMVALFSLSRSHSGSFVVIFAFYLDRCLFRADDLL